MITKQELVKSILDSTGAQVYYYYPAAWTRLPVISWRESGNRCFRQADGQEYLSELTYAVDIWAASPEAARDLAETVDQRMLAARFRRELSADLFETLTRYHHRSLRYRCIADAEGNMYQ